MFKRTLWTLIIIFISFPVFSQTMFQNGIITGDRVRIREKPSINSNILVTAKANLQVTVIDAIKTDDIQYKLWYRVIIPEIDIDGYIFSNFIKIDESYFKEYSQDKSIRIEFKNHEVNIYFNDTNIKIMQVLIKGLTRTIECHREGPYLFLAIYDYINSGVSPELCGIINIPKAKWHIKLDAKHGNPNILSYSPTKKYVLIDTGTSASVRTLTIINLQEQKIEHECHYIPFDNNNVKWLENETIQYYQEDYECTDKTIEPLYMEGHYIKKLILWNHKNEILIKNCIRAS